MIPGRRARIEWNPGGPFRVSDQSMDPPDRTLRYSGGACFTMWQGMPPSEEAAIVAWALHTAFAALEDGCDFKQVKQELEKVYFDFNFEKLMFEDGYLDRVRARTEVLV